MLELSVRVDVLCMNNTLLGGASFDLVCFYPTTPEGG